MTPIDPFQVFRLREHSRRINDWVRYPGTDLWIREYDAPWSAEITPLEELPRRTGKLAFDSFRVSIRRFDHEIESRIFHSTKGASRWADLRIWGVEPNSRSEDFHPEFPPGWEESPPLHRIPGDPGREEVSPEASKPN